MQKEIEVFKAINTISDFLDMETQKCFNAMTCLLEKDKAEKLRETYNLVVNFYKLPLEERAAKMGFEIVKE